MILNDMVAQGYRVALRPARFGAVFVAQTAPVAARSREGGKYRSSTTRHRSRLHLCLHLYAKCFLHKITFQILYYTSGCPQLKV